MAKLQELLAASAARHSHLCPRQVLGVRIGLAGAASLRLAAPRADKRLIVVVETDGCFVDGIEAATGVSVGRRTLRVEDYGKIAATFIDKKNERAVRIAPKPGIRQAARRYALPNERSRYHIQLHAYQIMPLEELLTCQDVQLSTPLKVIISRPGLRTQCSQCGEEIINEREILRDRLVLCRSCAGPAYYRLSTAGTQCQPFN